MSPPPYYSSEYGGRVAQMSKQEAVIARKRLELLEKKKNAELARQVAAAQSGTASESVVPEKKTAFSLKISNPSLEHIEEETLTRKPAKNNFSNDGSFMENFMKITEAAAKKAKEERDKREKEEEELKKTNEAEESEEESDSEESEEENQNKPLNDFDENASNRQKSQQKALHQNRQNYPVNNRPIYKHSHNNEYQQSQSMQMFSVPGHPQQQDFRSNPPIHPPPPPQFMNPRSAQPPPSFAPPRMHLPHGPNNISFGNSGAGPPAGMLRQFNHSGPPRPIISHYSQIGPSMMPNSQVSMPIMQTPHDFTLSASGVPPPPPPSRPSGEITSSGKEPVSQCSLNTQQNLQMLPLSLTNIPPPFELDLNTIPEPAINVETIRIPEFPVPDGRAINNSEGSFNQKSREHLNEDNVLGTERQTVESGNNSRNYYAYSDHKVNIQQQHRHHEENTAFNSPTHLANNFFSANVHTNVSTVDALIESVATYGDNYEEKVRSEHQNSMRSPFWFLNEKNSLPYRKYKQAVDQKRIQNSQEGEKNKEMVSDGEKYDPADILSDEDDIENNYKRTTGSFGENFEAEENTAQEANNLTQSHLTHQSEDYDSDSEYLRGAKERNYTSMKRNLDSTKGPSNMISFLGSQYDSSDEDEHMEMYQKIQMQEAVKDERNNSSPRLHSEASQPFFQLLHNESNASRQPRRSGSQSMDSDMSRKKKRSRWGDKVDTKPPPPALMSLNIPPIPPNNIPSFSKSNTTTTLSTITRTDPALLAYARQNYGTTQLSEEDWTKCEDHYKVNLLYQDMLRKRNEIDLLAKSGQFKYEYDSDEDVAGGTWEHKLRNAEMEATSIWADALTKQSEGKHHIGDFLPPEELKKFMEQYDAKKTNREPDLSDYKEYKLREDNKGFQMLQKLGWKEGQGLGFDGSGILNPVNKAPQRENNQGLGVASVAAPESGDNEYDAYRKRMMLAYRFRPNPLNNPRRAYY